MIMNTTANTRCHRVTHAPIGAYVLLLILGFTVASCEKEPVDPAYGLQSHTREKNLYRVLDKMATFPHVEDDSYAASFVGRIGSREVSVQGRPGAGNANPYFARIGQVLVVRSTKPYIDTEEFAEGRSMLEIQLFKHFDDEGDIGTRLTWQLPVTHGEEPKSKREWLDAILTKRFVPGREVNIATKPETTDTTMVSDKPEFFMTVTGSGENFDLQQSEYADDHRSLTCTSFSRDEEPGGIRYIFELDVRHGIAGHSKGANQAWIPVVGKLRINYLFVD